ncbi:hypothetical protein BD289DRAFT_185760 [Coniella lustricola]|uniref:Uncharacterized protein n=1 Tax=Coniella lustricola TaxID=2025994 RepID=A0A2T2ZT20_9PEZI|nr:hypothetical protein BD289DRAFT_185760 [Coniella lustricola]
MARTNTTLRASDTARNTLFVRATAHGPGSCNECNRPDSSTIPEQRDRGQWTCSPWHAETALARLTILCLFRHVRLASVTVDPGSCLAWPEIAKTGLDDCPLFSCFTGAMFSFSQFFALFHRRGSCLLAECQAHLTRRVVPLSWCLSRMACLSLVHAL